MSIGGEVWDRDRGASCLGAAEAPGGDNVFLEVALKLVYKMINDVAAVVLRPHISCLVPSGAQHLLGFSNARAD